MEGKCSISVGAAHSLARQGTQQDYTACMYITVRSVIYSYLARSPFRDFRLSGQVCHLQQMFTAQSKNKKSTDLTDLLERSPGQF